LKKLVFVDPGHRANTWIPNGRFSSAMASLNEVTNALGRRIGGHKRDRLKAGGGRYIYNNAVLSFTHLWQEAMCDRNEVNER
jgi:hypothetical protein